MNIKVRGKRDDPDRILQERIQNALHKVAIGEISDLECPYCSSRPLRFSYTNWAPDGYGVWISCEFCNHEAHLRLIGRPSGYDEKYVLKEFQERDERAAKAVDEMLKKQSGKG